MAKLKRELAHFFNQSKVRPKLIVGHLLEQVFLRLVPAACVSFELVHWIATYKKITYSITSLENIWQNSPNTSAPASMKRNRVVDKRLNISGCFFFICSAM